MAEEKPVPLVPGTGDAPQKAAVSRGGRTPSRQRGKIFAVLFAMLTLVGVMIGLFYYIRRVHEPLVLSFPITEYDRRYPPNPFAEQDSQLLLSHFPERSKLAYEYQEKDRLVKGLQSLAKEEKVPVVVHICAYAVQRGSEVYLLPGDAKPDEPESWLALTKLLSLLKSCPAQHKLLLLDIMRPLADFRLGVLTDTVAEGVETILGNLEKKKDLPCFVLCACSRGEFSLVSEELGQSVFAYYLSQGLDGWADGYNDTGKRDNRVSVKELCAFVTARVSRWADPNRHTRQTPILFGQDKPDFTLIELAREPSPGPDLAAETEAEPTVPSYPDWLSEQWKCRDCWRAKESFRFAPLAFRELEVIILRAEQQWRGGRDGGRIRTPLKAQVHYLEAQIHLSVEQSEQASPRDPLGPRTLARAAGKVKADSEACNSLRSLLAKLASSKAEETAEARKKFLQGFKDKPVPLLARTVFDVAADDQKLSPEKLRLLAELLQGSPTAASYLETDLLCRLAIVKSDPSGRWPAEAVHQALQAVRAEAEVLTADPLALSLVRPRLEAADKQCRQAVELLLNSTSVPKVPVGEFLAIERAVRAVEQAQSAYDKALAVLPGYVPYLLNRSEPDSGTPSAWTGAVNAAVSLARILADPSPEDLRPMEKVTNDLRWNLRSLERPFTEEKDSEREALLMSPWPAADQRAQLWAAQRQLGWKLNRDTLRCDRDENRRKVRTGLLPASVSPSTRSPELGKLRVQLASDLLKLGGLTGVETLSVERGDALRQAWSSELGRQLQDHWDQRDWATADRLSRVLHPFDDQGGFADVNRNPTLRLRQEKSAWFRQWVAELRPKQLHPARPGRDESAN
jgi:hypothetical protein